MNRKNKIYRLYIIASKDQNLNLKDKLKYFIGSAGIASSIIGGAALNSGNNDEGVISEPHQIVDESNISFEEDLEYVEYTIKPGDNIYNISRRIFYGHSDRAMKNIISKNKMSKNDFSNLRVGQKILIPKDRESFIAKYKLEENHNMIASDNIKNFIKKEESFCPLPEDIERNGIYTIGFGHRLETDFEKEEYNKLKNKMINSGRKKGELKPNDPEILQIFERDIKEAEDKIKNAALTKLDQKQFDSLASYVFNTGGLPNIEKDILNQNIISAANKIKSGAGYDMVGHSGLKDRRNKESLIFTGDLKY